MPRADAFKLALAKTIQDAASNALVAPEDPLLQHVEYQVMSQRGLELIIRAKPMGPEARCTFYGSRYFTVQLKET